MKVLLEIIQAIFALIAGRKKEKILTPKSDYELSSLSEDIELTVEPIQVEFEPEKNIICNNHEVYIDWDDTILWTQPGALMCKSNQYKTIAGNRGQSIDKVVIHWDGCLNSAQCAKVLGQRGLSAQFCIDNDGTIHQLMDTNHVAWHARGVNSRSIGIEISNAVYPKYASKYDPPRPIAAASTLHGKPFPAHLDFHKVQVDALKSLLKSLCGFYNVPLEFPNQNGELIRGVIKASSFKGVICHYHITEEKTDPACLDLAKVIKEIKDEI